MKLVRYRSTTGGLLFRRKLKTIQILKKLLKKELVTICNQKKEEEK